MMFAFMLIAGVALLSLALRTFDHPLPRRLGVFGIFGTSFLIGWLFAHSILAGGICAASWLLLPWLEILTRVRKLRLPVEKNLRHRTAPSRDQFPALPQLTSEIEEESFEYITDAGWEWDEYQQYFRLFYKGNERTQVAVCMIDQQNVAFYYVSIASRAADGTTWTTWNYPFSYSLKLVPQWRTNRVRSDLSFGEMYDRHRDWLLRRGVNVEQLVDLDAGQMELAIQKDMRAQIAHNLAAGVLKRSDENHVRYSWWGLIFIWLQFLRDLVRLS